MTTLGIWKPNVLVLGPGGAKGYLELGFLQKLYQENYLDKINSFVGCSIGSAISLLLVSGYAVEEIIEDCINIPLVSDLSDINLENIKELPGLLKIRNVENLLKNRTEKKFGFVPSLKQLYLFTGIQLIVVAFNLDKMEREYLCHNSTPDLSVVEAVMMSMAVPGLICPRIYRGFTYVDGAVGDPYPILFLDNGTNKILGIYIDSESTIGYSNKSIFRYFYRCAQASMKILRDQAIELSSSKCKHVALRSNIMDTIGITLSSESKRKLIQFGFMEAEKYLQKIQNPENNSPSEDELPLVDDIVLNSKKDEEDLFVSDIF